MVFLVIAIVVSTASLIVKSVKNSDDKKNASLDQKIKDENFKDWLFMDVENYVQQSNGIRQVETNRYNLNRSQNNLKVRLAIDQIISNPKFASNCAIEYKETGINSEICASGGFNEDRLIAIEDKNRKTEDQLYKKKITGILFIDCVINYNNCNDII